MLDKNSTVGNIAVFELGLYPNIRIPMLLFSDTILHVIPNYFGLKHFTIQRTVYEQLKKCYFEQWNFKGDLPN